MIVWLISLGRWLAMMSERPNLRLFGDALCQPR
jgi:hypothetical protein